MNCCFLSHRLLMQHHSCFSYHNWLLLKLYILFHWFCLFFIFGILFDRVRVTCWKSWFWRELKPCLKCLQGHQQVRLPRHNILYSAHSFSFLQHKSGCSARRHAWAEMLMAVGNTGYLVIVFCHPSFTPGVVSYTLPWTLARYAAYLFAVAGNTSILY